MTDAARHRAFDPAAMSSNDAYHLLNAVVVPRPIALVTTLDENGSVNAAPFSFFNAFSSNPPVVVFSPGLAADGRKKDTLRNVEATGEFVGPGTPTRPRRDGQPTIPFRRWGFLSRPLNLDPQMNHVEERRVNEESAS